MSHIEWYIPKYSYFLGVSFFCKTFEDFYDNPISSNILTITAVHP